MPLARYLSNKDPNDPVAALKLNPSEDGLERVLERGGDPLEVSDEEFADLSRRYDLVDPDAVDESDEEQKEVAPPASVPSLISTASSQSGASSSPSTPGQGSQGVK